MRRVKLCVAAHRGGLTQGQQRRLGRLVEHFEQRLGRTRGATLALFPVANGVQRHINPVRELKLRQAQTLAHAPGKFRGVQQSVGVIGLLLQRQVLLGGRI